MYACMYVRIYLYMCICVYVCIYVVCMYVYVYVRMYVWMDVCMCVCVCGRVIYIRISYVYPWHAKFFETAMDVRNRNKICCKTRNCFLSMLI